MRCWYLFIILALSLHQLLGRLQSEEYWFDELRCMRPRGFCGCLLKLGLLLMRCGFFFGRTWCIRLRLLQRGYFRLLNWGNFVRSVPLRSVGVCRGSAVRSKLSWGLLSGLGACMHWLPIWTLLRGGWCDSIDGVHRLPSRYICCPIRSYVL